jgi:hypothetical protein
LRYLTDSLVQQCILLEASRPLVHATTSCSYLFQMPVVLNRIKEILSPHLGVQRSLLLIFNDKLSRHKSRQWVASTSRTRPTPPLSDELGHVISIAACKVTFDMSAAVDGRPCVVVAPFRHASDGTDLIGSPLNDGPHVANANTKPPTPRARKLWSHRPRGHGCSP